MRIFTHNNKKNTLGTITKIYLLSTFESIKCNFLQYTITTERQQGVFLQLELVRESLHRHQCQVDTSAQRFRMNVFAELAACQIVEARGGSHLHSKPI